MSKLTRIVAVFTGYYYSCAISNIGGLKCWGNNDGGQLGDRTHTSQLEPVQVWNLSAGVVAGSGGLLHACALLGSGAVECWGRNGDGELGDGTTRDHLAPASVSGLSNGVDAIALGEAHSCALISTGSVKCWGDNYFGSTGDGTTQNQREAPVPTKNYAGTVRARAQLDTPRLTSGTHTMGAAYQGDASHAGSSASLTQTVN